MQVGEKLWAWIQKVGAMQQLSQVANHATMLKCTDCGPLTEVDMYCQSRPLKMRATILRIRGSYLEEVHGDAVRAWLRQRGPVCVVVHVVDSFLFGQ